MYSNKDENVHRYAVRGERKRERERERERETKKHERKRVTKGNLIDF